MQIITYWLLLKTFASGCAAMTGVEAVSNGVTAFREPRSKNATATLTVIIATLIVLLYGLSFLAKAYHLTAMDPDATNYQSVLSILLPLSLAAAGSTSSPWPPCSRHFSFSANTAFADFPRMARAIAAHDYLPHVFTVRGGACCSHTASTPSRALPR